MTKSSPLAQAYKILGTPPELWVWMPHPAHFICAPWCHFHLATWVGGYIVSTVGEYLPDEGVREILANSRRITADYMKKIGYEEVRHDRLYETMVFAAADTEETCCPYRPTSWSELDAKGYNTAEEARLGHMSLCLKWSRT